MTGKNQQDSQSQRGTQASSQCSSSDPDQRLGELNEMLEQDKKKIDDLTKHCDALKEDIDALQKANNDLKQVVQAYGQAYPTLKNDHSSYSSYVAMKMQMAECALGERKDGVDEKIEEFDGEIEAKEQALESLRAEKDNAWDAYQAAKTALDEKQAVFDYWKNYKTHLEKNINEIKALKTQIDKEEGANHPAGIYFLAIELKKILDATKVIAQDELKSKLYKSWDQLTTAKEVVREKKSAWEEAKSKHDAAQKELDDLKSKRREKIMEIISSYNEEPKYRSTGQTAA
jgi:chromosome segregation ATPase